MPAQCLLGLELLISEISRCTNAKGLQTSIQQTKFSWILLPKCFSSIIAISASAILSVSNSYFLMLSALQKLVKSKNSESGITIPNGKMENDLLFSVYYLLLLESTPPSTTRLKLLYPKRGPVFLVLLVYHVGSPRSTLAPLTQCTRLYSKLNYLYRIFLFFLSLH